MLDHPFITSKFPSVDKWVLGLVVIIIYSILTLIFLGFVYGFLALVIFVATLPSSILDPLIIAILIIVVPWAVGETFTAGP